MSDVPALLKIWIEVLTAWTKWLGPTSPEVSGGVPLPPLATLMPSTFTPVVGAFELTAESRAGSACVGARPGAPLDGTWRAGLALDGPGWAVMSRRGGEMSPWLGAMTSGGPPGEPALGAGGVWA